MPKSLPITPLTSVILSTNVATKTIVQQGHPIMKTSFDVGFKIRYELKPESEVLLIEYLFHMPQCAVFKFVVYCGSHNGLLCVQYKAIANKY